MSQMLSAGPPAPPAVGVVRVELHYNHFQTGSRPPPPTLPLVSHPHLYSSPNFPATIGCYVTGILTKIITTRMSLLVSGDKDERGAERPV